MDGIVVDDLPGSGPYNMAVDRALVDFVRDNHLCVLRWYRWSEPTVSLGYFQSYSEFSKRNELANLPVVRRETGGGAIVHHLELTYSCTIVDGTQKGHHQGFYRLIHNAAVGCLQAYLPGVGLHDSAGERGCSSDCGKDRFLCFERRSPMDVTAHGFKILGSAQKRYANVLAQHGSILLGASPSTPDLLGFQDLLDRRRSASADPKQLEVESGKTQIDAQELSNLLLEAFMDGLSKQLGVRWKTLLGDLRSHLPTFGMYEDQFKSFHWTHRR